MTEETISLGSLPFFWRIKKNAEDRVDGIPDRLPFELTIQEDIGLIIEKRRKDVSTCLKKIYHLDANIGFLQDGHSLADSYGSEFHNFIESSVNKLGVQLNQITEIGCGGGYILKRYKNQGIKVRGIDPSPLAIRKGQDLGFEMVPEFYPTAHKLSPSDLIFHYDVLEHVDDPLSFLKANFNDLNVGGVLVAGLPDCTESIEVGDVSMAMHEHLNYFDDDSLRNALTEAGFHQIIIEKSKHGGLLFCAAQKLSMEPVQKKSLHIDQKKFEMFKKRFDSFSSRLGQYVRETLSTPGQSLGFYVPLRAFPYMTLFNAFEGVRLFDDSKTLHRGFYDGVNIPVENFEDFVANPPSKLIVMSFRFHDVIEKKIRDRLGNRVEIRSLRSFV